MSTQLTQQEARSILEVTIHSTSQEIKQAYRKKAQYYHPDKNKNNKEAEEEFKKCVNAYQTLKEHRKDLEFTPSDFRNKQEYSNFFNDPLLRELFFMQNPRYMLNYLSKLLEDAKPRKVESLLGKLLEEEYTPARNMYLNNKKQAKKDSKSIKETIQQNIGKTPITSLLKRDSPRDLETQLNELSYYSKELDFDYQTSLEEISDVVLERLEKKVLEEQPRYIKTSFEDYLESKFTILDSIPLDTDKIELKFKTKMISQTMEELKNEHNLEKIKTTVEKIALLDEYFSPENDENKLLKESYQYFLEPRRGKKLYGRDRKLVASVLSTYFLHGIPQAKKARSIVRMVGRI